MAIYHGLAGFRVRPDAEPSYIHEVCKQELKVYPGRQNKDDARVVLKCDACDTVIGEWLSEAEMNRELSTWFEANAA
jgi:hypothetical protein